MKKIIATILSIFFTTSVFAKNIEILTTSTLKGPPGVVINTISDLTKNNGLKFVGRQSSGCGEAVDLFDNAKEPIAIIWSDTLYKHTETTKQNCVINFETAKPIAVTFAAYDVCVRKDFTLESGKTYTIGNAKFNPTKSMTDHLNNNNKNIKFKNVSYEGSAQTIVGLINKDIDVGYIAAVNSAPAIAAGTIDCLYSTGSTKHGQKPLSEFAGKNALSEYKLGMMVFVKNMSAEQILALEKSLTNGFISAMDQQNLINSKVGINKADLDKFIFTARANVQYQ